MSPGAIRPADTSVDLVDTTIGDALRDRARLTPHRPALLWLEGGELIPLTFRQLLRAAETGAAALLELAGPGGRVAVWAPNSEPWVVAEYAAALAGTPLVPLNPALADPEAAHIMKQSGAALVLAVAEARGKLLLGRAEALARDIPSIRAVVELSQWRRGRPSAALPTVSPDDCFLIQYTSGTTGRPKGAVISHRAAYNCGRFSPLA